MDKRCTWSKLLLVVPAAGIAVGCTFVQGRLRTSVEMKGISYDQALQLATRAAMDAGFAVTPAAEGSGMITASRGGAFLLSQNETIYISVSNDGRRSTLSVAGEASDYAAITNALSSFCLALQRRQPTAVCRT